MKKHLRNRSLLVGVACALVLAACGEADDGEVDADPTPEDTVDDDSDEPDEAAAELPEGDLRAIVSVSPGGGWDTAVRTFTNYLEVELDRNVVVDNVTGAGGALGLHELLRSEPDGLTYGMLPLPGAPTGQIAGEDFGLPDSQDFLGSVAEEPYVTLASTASGFTTAEDLQAADQVVVGLSAGMSGGDALVNVLFSDELDITVDYVNHEGSAESTLAAVRGDVDLVTVPLSTGLPFVEEGDLVPMWIYGADPVEVEGVDFPRAAEVGLPVTAPLGVIYRSMSVPAGVDPGVLQTLRDATEAAATNPDFVAEMEAMGSTAVFRPADEIDQILRDTLELAGANQDQFQ